MSFPLSPQTPEQRRWAADKIGDMANLATAALLFAQVATGSYRVSATVTGAIILLVGAYYGNRLLKTCTSIIINLQTMNGIYIMGAAIILVMTIIALPTIISDARKQHRK